MHIRPSRHVRCGSKADFEIDPANVCFGPKWTFGRTAQMSAEASDTVVHRSHIKIVSDRYRDGVVFEESPVFGCSPDSGWILKRTSFVTGPKLDGVAAGFARTLIPRERLLYAGRSRERASQNECVLDCQASALAEKGRHWVSGIAQHTDPATSPIGQRLAIPQSPFEQGSRRNAMNEIEEIGREIGIVRCKLFIGRRNGPSFLFPLVGLSASNDVQNLSAA